MLLKIRIRPTKPSESVITDKTINFNRMIQLGVSRKIVPAQCMFSHLQELGFSTVQN